MGLNTTHGCWDGGYIGFSAWRNAVAIAAGFRMKLTGGYSLDAIEALFLPGGEPVPEAIFMGQWPFEPPDVLWVLLAHSDCDGEIPHKFTGPLADRLAGLATAIQAAWRNKTQTFIDGLRVAHAAGEPVEFH